MSHIIHQICLDERHDAAPALFTEAWKRLAARSGWEYRTWDKGSLAGLDMVNRRLFDRLLEYGALNQASGIARLEILRLHGGLYVQREFFPLFAGPIGEILPVRGLFTGVAEHVHRPGSPYGPGPLFRFQSSVQFCDGFMYAPPGCPVADMLARGLDDAVFHRQLNGDGVQDMTGPGWTSAVARQYPVIALPNWSVNLGPEQAASQFAPWWSRLLACYVNDCDVMRLHCLPHLQHGAVGDDIEQNTPVGLEPVNGPPDVANAALFPVEVVAGDQPALAHPGQPVDGVPLGLRPVVPVDGEQIDGA